MTPYEQTRAYWNHQNIDSVETIDRVLYNFRILFAYNSGKIENEEINYHDTREIFENGKVLNYTGMPRTLFEQQNQRLCYEFLKNKIVSKEMISLEMVKETHSILTAGTYDEHRYIDRGERPGEFKKHDYITGINEVGYAPEDVEDAIADLIGELNDVADSSDKIMAAAYFHASFENIHPFADGNGRVGRTLMNYFLMTHGEPPLVVYDEDKKRYYAALEQYDTSEELQELCEFLKYETAKTWEKTIERSQGNYRKCNKKLEDVE
ncbi:MAG: Fic family protein [Oscillospiraceae bacterium]